MTPQERFAAAKSLAEEVKTLEAIYDLKCRELRQSEQDLQHKMCEMANMSYDLLKAIKSNHFVSDGKFYAIGEKQFRGQTYHYVEEVSPATV